MLEIAILGAGVAGLGAAYASKFQYPIYEAKPYAGGLCASFQIKGFRFDRAVHLSFTTSDIVKKVFDKTSYLCHYPYPRSWYYDRWIKHPVQNNLYVLPPIQKLQAVKSFIERPIEQEPQNFREWNISRFGQYISEEFSLCYNRKYWCEDLSKLGVSWIEGRLYQPRLEEVLLGSYTENTENTYYAKEMRYPKKGGYEAFLREIVEKTDIHYGKKVVKINGGKREIYFSDGFQTSYQKVISSIPLTEMKTILTDAPLEVISAIEKLNYTGVVLVSIGFRKKINLDDLWFYIYDKDILAARAYSPSNKSPDNAPDGCASLQFEIYFNGKSSPPKRKNVLENVYKLLERMINNHAIALDIKQDILFVDYSILPYGNIIMYPENGGNSRIIKEYLKEIGIISIGRFGEWEYLWSDQAFLSGYDSVINC